MSIHPFFIIPPSVSNTPLHHPYERTHTQGSLIFNMTMFGFSTVSMEHEQHTRHTETFTTLAINTAHTNDTEKKHFFLSPINISLFLSSLFQIDCTTLAINFPLSFHHSVRGPLHLCLPILACLILFVLRSRSH